MKIITLIITLIIALCLQGCVVPTTYEKSFSITRDVNGNITSTTESESVIQHNKDEFPIKLKILKL